DACRGGAGADGAGRAVVLVVTVRAALAFEVVPLHATGEALALRDGRDVDLLAGLEDAGVDLLADLVARSVVEAKLNETLSRSHGVLLEVACLRLGQRVLSAKAV